MSTNDQKSKQDPAMLVEKCGFIDCQLAVVDEIMRREKEALDQIRGLKNELAKIDGITVEKQKMLSELSEQIGQARVLRSLSRYVFSLQVSSKGEH